MQLNKHCLFQVPCDVSFVVKQNQGKAMTKGSGQTEVFEIVPNRCTIFPYSEVYCVVHFTPAAIQLYSATIEVLLRIIPCFHLFVARYNRVTF